MEITDFSMIIGAIAAILPIIVIAMLVLLKKFENDLIANMTNRIIALFVAYIVFIVFVFVSYNQIVVMSELIEKSTIAALSLVILFLMAFSFKIFKENSNQ